MEYRNTPDGPAWVPAEEEQRALRANGPEVESQAGPSGLLARHPSRNGTSEMSRPSQSLERDWAGDSARVEVRQGIAELLATRGYVFVEADDLHVPAVLLQDRLRIAMEYGELQHQPFGGSGQRGFFAGRTIGTGAMVFAPGECESAEWENLLLALAAATLRTLPGYHRDKAHIVAFLFSRHCSSVEAMPAHHDAVDWLAQFNLERSSEIRGGAIQLSDRQGHVVEERTLSKPFDGYIVRDSQFRHGVTRVEIEPPNHRDVVILRMAQLE